MRRSARLQGLTTPNTSNITPSTTVKTFTPQAETISNTPVTRIAAVTPGTTMSASTPIIASTAMTSRLNSMEASDIKTLPICKGKSIWVAKQLLDAVENLRSTYRWDEAKTARIFGSRLKGRKIEEWFCIVSNLPSDGNQWTVLKEAFERKYVKLSKSKRWREIKRIKQGKREDLEVYSGRVQTLIGPLQMDEEQRITLFISGLRKNLRRRVVKASDYKSVQEVVRALLAEADYDSDSDSDNSSSDDESSSDSSDTDSDNERKRKKKKKKKVPKKAQTEDTTKLKMEIRNLQKQLRNMKTNHVFAVDNRPYPQIRGLRTTTGIDICTRCQRVGHKDDNCPRKQLTCYKCGTKGHVTGECRVRVERRNPVSSPGQNIVVTCYRCGKPGHRANECATRPVARAPQRPEEPRSDRLNV